MPEFTNPAGSNTAKSYSRIIEKYQELTVPFADHRISSLKNKEQRSMV
jgi:hypothetical protein